MLLDLLAVWKLARVPTLTIQPRDEDDDNASASNFVEPHHILNPIPSPSNHKLFGFTSGSENSNVGGLPSLQSNSQHAIENGTCDDVRKQTL